MYSNIKIILFFSVVVRGHRDKTTLISRFLFLSVTPVIYVT